MTKTTLTLVASLLSMGCGKTSIDALCADGCERAVTWAKRCASTFPEGEIDVAACKTGCIENAEAADAAGCADEFRAVATCVKRTNWDAMECSIEALFTLCAAEQSALNACQGVDTGEWGEWDSGDWDTGW